MQTNSLKTSKNDSTLYTIITIVALATIFTDSYPVIMATLAKYFDTTKATIQKSFSVVAFTSLVANIIYPIIFKKIGIKNTIACTSFISVFLGIACAFSDNLYLFLICMFILSLTTKANTSSGVPLIRDLSDDHKECSLYMSKLNFYRAFIGIITPLIAGFLTEHTSWKFVFIIISIYSIFITIKSYNLGARFNKEILEKHNTLAIYKEALTHKTFIFFTSLRMLIAAGTFAYIVELPFLLHNLDYSISTIGIIFFIINSGFVLGTVLSTKLLQVRTPSHSATVGLILILIGGMTPIIVKEFLNQILLSTLIIAIYCAGTRMLDPLITSRVLFLFPKDYASTISGIFFVCRAISATVFTYILSHTESDITLYIVLFASSTLILTMMLSYQAYNKKPTF
ncbi:MAG: MFS transporter [Rickettsiales bacterium]|nr:MFS transporter [Rickettsiales bacterium]